MKRLWRRLRRLLGQSRIVLPRRPLIPEDLRRGDRLQIGPAVFRVRGRLRLESGPWAFRLEDLEGPNDGPVRLLEREGAWTLLRGGGRVEVPVDCVVHYRVERTSRTQGTKKTKRKNGLHPFVLHVLDVL